MMTNDAVGCETLRGSTLNGVRSKSGFASLESLCPHSYSALCNSDSTSGTRRREGRCCARSRPDAVRSSA